LDRRLGGQQSQSGGGGEKNSQPLPGLGTPIIQPVAQRCTTELGKHWWSIRNKFVFNLLVTERSADGV